MRSRGSRSSSSSARAPARASRASAASPTPPRLAPYDPPPPSRYQPPEDSLWFCFLTVLGVMLAVCLSCPVRRFASRQQSRGTGTEGATPPFSCVMSRRLALLTSLSTLESMCYCLHYQLLLLSSATSNGLSYLKLELWVEIVENTQSVSLF